MSLFLGVILLIPLSQSIHLTANASTRGNIQLPGANIGGIALNSLTHRLYVIDRNNSSVIAIDTLQLKEISSIYAGPSPSKIVVNQATNKIFVTHACGCSADANLTIIDGRTNSVADTFTLSGRTVNGTTSFPITNIASDSTSDDIYFGAKDGLFVRFDASSNAIRSFYNWPAAPSAMASKSPLYTISDQQLVYTDSTGERVDLKIEPIQNNTSVASNELIGIAYNTRTNFIYLLNGPTSFASQGNENGSTTATGYVSVVNATSQSLLPNSIFQIQAPFDIEINDISGRAYATDGDGILIIDGVANNKIVEKLPLFKQGTARFLAVDDLLQTIYVASSTSEIAVVYDGDIATALGSSQVHGNYFQGHSGPRLSILSADKNDVYVVWVNQTGNYDIFFKRSTDNGTTFENTINISNNTPVSDDPQMAISGNNVYIAWSDETYRVNPGAGGGILPYYYHIMFKRSTDGGHTFSSQPLVLDQNFSSFQSGISIAAVENNVYVVWEMALSSPPSESLNFQVYFAKSSDYGATFSPAINIGNLLPNSSYSPQVAAFGSNVYVTWFNAELFPCLPNYPNGHLFNGCSASGVYFRRSTDFGNSFDNIIAVPNTVGVQNPKLGISADGKYVYLAWQPTYAPGSSSHTGFIARSTDGGSSFDAASSFPEPISAHPLFAQRTIPSNSTYAYPTSIYTPTSKPNEVYVAFGALLSTTFNNTFSIPVLSTAYIAKSADYGQSFGNLLPVINNVTYVYNSAAYKQLSVTDNGTIYAVWISNSTDSGTSSKSNSFVNSNRSSSNTNSSASGNAYNLLFNRQTFSSNNLTRLIGSQVIDLSNNETPFPNEQKPTPLLSGGPPEAHVLVNTPMIATSGSNVYVAWQTSYQNGQDIFFTRSANGGESFANIVDITRDNGLGFVPEFSFSLIALVTLVGIAAAAAATGTIRRMNKSKF